MFKLSWVDILLIIFWIYMIAINVFAFLTYGYDKRQAKKHEKRVSELALLSLAIFGGALGAFLSMIVFRHKIRKKKFMIIVPLLVAGEIILWLFMIQVNYIGYTSTKRQEEVFDLETADLDPEIYDYSKLEHPYESSVDKDGDGIEDQADILASALEYVATKPLYRRKSYKDGYPTDRNGVNADVVAFALKGAGYDLKEMVNEDIRKDPEAYGIEEPDENMDFRRVENLIIFFERNAIPVSTNVSEIEEWQGGDIVVFSDHIGIVSDRRNIHGVPFIIHHKTRLQKRYEDDVLVKYRNLVGHYRIS